MRTRRVIWPLLTLLTACASTPAAYEAPRKAIEQELAGAAKVSTPAAAPAAKSQADVLGAALMPPLKLDLPNVSRAAEPRFDLVVSNAPASQVLLGIVAGTRYSMLLPPDLAGQVTVNLKDVTVLEALSALKQLYGYEYTVEGNRIYVQTQALQTRILRINYLNAQRSGSSDLRVISGSVSDNGDSGNSTSSSAGSQGSSGGGAAFETSKISTRSQSNFWVELTTALKAIVGDKDGRNVVVSPQSGIIVVRAMPAELSQVEAFLGASQLALERQVILEAKIIEVELNNSFQSGINWAAFTNGGTSSRASIGSVSPGVTIGKNGVLINPGAISGTPGSTLGNAADAAGAMFGLVFRTGNFAAILNFLEEQGTVNVLSSPRIATLNNQKAVLKVGTDDFFVTSVTTTTTTGTATTSTPTVNLKPFFSGITLDVTPQIDENSNITLHVHPSVSKVTAVTQQLDLGDMGSLQLPLASSDVSETDSVVRAQDGQIIALGGLIRQGATNNASQVPLLGKLPLVGHLFRQKGQNVSKRELVILLRPTVIQSGATWNAELNRIDSRINGMLGTQPAAGQ